MEIPSPAGDPIAGNPPAGDPPAGRPAGGTEQSWCRAVRGGTGITVLAILLSRSPSLPLLRSSLRRLQLSHPILRSNLGGGGGQSPAILISPILSDEIDLIDSTSFFHPILEQELNRNPWADPEPDDQKPVRSFFVSIYNLRESVRTVLVLRLHTGVCDRIAGVAILKELMDFMRGEEEEEEGVEREGEVCLAMEDLIRKEDGYKPFWMRGKDLIGYSLNGLRSSGLGFRDAGSERRSEFVRLVVDEGKTKRLVDVSRMEGLCVFFFFGF